MDTKPRHERSHRLTIAVVLMIAALYGDLFRVTRAASNDVVPTEFVGDWVPAQGSCDSTVRLRAEPGRLTLINDRDSASYADLHMAASYFGPEYAGICRVVVPDSGKDDPPFLAFFNHDERKGVTLLDIYTPGPPSAHAALAAMQAAHQKLAQRFPLNNIPLKKCALAGSIASAPASRSPTKIPRVCAGAAFCEETNDFAVTVTDFRASLNAPTKVLTATMRFLNKTDHPLTLGYIPGSGVGADERGNRYSANDSDVRGIGLIGTRSVDDKFTLAPGQESDARFTYLWGAGREIFGTTFEIELTVRQIVPLGSGQLELGVESPLRFTGLTHRSIVATARGASSSTPAAGGSPSPSRGAPPPQGDHCEGSARPCYDAGPFSATLVDMTQAMVAARHHTVRMNIAFKNWSDQPLILAYKNASNSMTDDLGNAYHWGRAGTHDGSVHGIGLVIPGRSSDSSFRLAPGQSGNAAISMIRYEAGNRPKGTSFTLDSVIVELNILANGQQSEIVREYSVHLPDLTLSAAASTSPDSDNLKKAAKKIRGLFGGKK